MDQLSGQAPALDPGQIEGVGAKQDDHQRLLVTDPAGVPEKDVGGVYEKWASHSHANERRIQGAHPNGHGRQVPRVHSDEELGDRGLRGGGGAHDRGSKAEVR